MNSEEVRVANLVRDAFRGVTLGGGIGLRQGQGLDDYASEEALETYRSCNEKIDWTRIDSLDLSNYSSSLSFFDAEGMRFHLPAYLIADLADTLNADIVFHLVCAEHGAQSRFGLLSRQQREAVRQFLLLRRSESGFSGPMIDEALKTYWLPETGTRGGGVN